MIEASKRTKERNIQTNGNIRKSDWRESSQPLLSDRLAVFPVDGAYNPMPSHALGSSKIGNGFAALAEWISPKIRC